MSLSGVVGGVSAAVSSAATQYISTGTIDVNQVLMDGMTGGLSAAVTARNLYRYNRAADDGSRRLVGKFPPKLASPTPWDDTATAAAAASGGIIPRLGRRPSSIGRPGQLPGQPAPFPDPRVRNPKWKSTWVDPAVARPGETKEQARNRAASANAKKLKEVLKIGSLAKDGREAHHIVQANNGKDAVFQKNRDLLEKYHIDINGKENGVALQASQRKNGVVVKQNEGLRKHHGELLHSKAVGKDINYRLKRAEQRGSTWEKRRVEIVKELVLQR